MNDAIDEFKKKHGRYPKQATQSDIDFLRSKFDGDEMMESICDCVEMYYLTAFDLKALKNAIRDVFRRV